MLKFALLLWLALLPISNGFAEPPPASSVFFLTTKPIDPNTFALQWTIKKGFFLYKKRIKLVTPDNANFHLGEIRFPNSEKKTDALGKTYRVYVDQLTLPVSILGEEPGEALLKVGYQGCSNDGFCYPPIVNQVKLTIDKQLSLSEVSIEELPADDVKADSNSTSQETMSRLFQGRGVIMIVFSFFVFGLLLSFTPCVLPMVPVLSGIIVGYGKDISTRKAFFLSLSYVISMSITYAIIGAVVAEMGHNLQLMMQSPWAISFFALIFVLLALSMFNLYEFQLPASWQTTLAKLMRSKQGGHYLSSALMGSLSILILSPCVTPPLIGALSYIAQTGNVLLGSVALFFLSLGMGTPLLLIGTSAGQLIPHAGAWMNTVKAFFGILLLAVAIFLMDRVLPALMTMVLWGSLLIFTGLFLEAFRKKTTYRARIKQGFGIILFVYGLLILVGASIGNRNPLEPLKGLNVGSPIANKEKTVIATSLTDVSELLKKARGKPVMLDFYADWCASCKVLESTTLQNANIQKWLSRFVVIKIDVTANDKQATELLSHFHVIAPPTFIFYNAKGKELPMNRLYGEVSADALSHQLKTTYDDLRPSVSGKWIAPLPDAQSSK